MQAFGEILQIEFSPTDLSKPWLDPQTALHQQVVLIQGFCQQSELLGISDALDRALILTIEPAHLRSSLSSFEIIALWDHLANHQFELSCNHPWAD